jgi:hypothetical protein
VLYPSIYTLLRTQNYCCVFPFILAILPLFCRFSLHVQITALPQFSVAFLSTPVCCSNYFKVIRALIAGRCFSGGQVPGGASPVTQFLPLRVAPCCHTVFRLPGLVFRSATLQHSGITAGVVPQFCTSCCACYFVTLLPHHFLRYALGPTVERLVGLRMRELRH